MTQYRLNKNFKIQGSDDDSY